MKEYGAYKESRGDQSVAPNDEKDKGEPVVRYSEELQVDH